MCEKQFWIKFFFALSFFQFSSFQFSYVLKWVRKIYYNTMHLISINVLSVSYFSGNIIFINNRFLEKHVKTSFILSQWMTSDFVNKLFQSFASIFNEIFFKQSFVATKRQLAFPRFTRKWRHHNLRVSLQFGSEPLEVTVPSPNWRLFQLEYWQVALRVNQDRSVLMDTSANVLLGVNEWLGPTHVWDQLVFGINSCLESTDTYPHPDLVICVSIPRDSVCNGIHDIDL